MHSYLHCLRCWHHRSRNTNRTSIRGSKIEGTNCDKLMTFCWSDSQVTAYGNRWVAPDKDEKPFEWVTEVRCLKDYKLCIPWNLEKEGPPRAKGAASWLEQ